MRNGIISFCLLAITMLACRQDAQKLGRSATQFEVVNAKHSGITFSNDIVENDTLNYYTFPYLYMGGGVAIGDINNDGLSDVFLTGNMVPNKLYLNKGDLQFEDISETAGLSGDDRWYTGVSMVDINNDGWLDIYVCVSGKHPPFNNQLFINNKDNTFTEQAAEYGLDDPTTSIQATFFDYDNDGFLDVFVGNYPQLKVTMGNEYYYRKMQENQLVESGHLYKNNGDGHFTDVTARAGVQNFGLTLGVAATDFNNDGYTDLYVSNDFNVPDYLYLNNGDGTFRETIKETTRHTSLFGMGTDAADFNNDGLMDIAQVDMTPEDYKRAKTNMASMSPSSFWQAVDLGLHYQYMQNSVQLNRGVDEQGLPQFSDIARMTGMATTDWSWGIQFMDLDNDGWKDVFISNGMKRDVNNNDVLAAFKEGSFFGEEFPDFAALPSEPIENYVFKNNGDLTFSKVNKDWGLSYTGFSNGFAHGDLDNDGDLDLIINNLDDEATFFQNKTKKETHHYLQVKLKGPKQNPFGLGAKVMIEDEDWHQFQELTLSRGFQSSVAPLLHFGLGERKMVKKVKVSWPDGKKQILEHIAADQVLELEYRKAYPGSELVEQKGKRFKNITEAAGLDFKHIEDDFDDFRREPLLPHKNSAMGPALAVGDVNGDQLDDFFIGNAAGEPGRLYVQDQDGLFQVQSGPWETEAQYEDTGALFFDADQDGDQDLYVVNGGNDPMRAGDYYQDRLYINTPSGFKRSLIALPKMPTSGQEVVIGDLDQDGKPDLFVGGRIVAGKYPEAAKAYILKNEGGTDENLRFLDVTLNYAPDLREAGLVTAAIWNDYNQDGLTDLILTGEWMPIRFFKNNGQQLEEMTEDIPGLEDLEGWWYSLAAGDPDQDGDTDYIAGNLGLNYKYKASSDEPFEIYANDFDENNSLDIVLSYHKKGELLPVRGRECSAQQVPAIAARFETFEAFADADLPELYGDEMLANALHLDSKTFESCWLENKGTAGFERHPLPAIAQLSSINAIEWIDYNGDAFQDLLLFGNLYGSEVETPRNDAGLGQVLVGGPHGSFTPVSAQESGLIVTGEVKNIAPIRWGAQQQTAFLIARNNDTLQLILLNQQGFAPIE